MSDTNEEAPIGERDRGSNAQNCETLGPDANHTIDPGFTPEDERTFIRLRILGGARENAERVDNQTAREKYGVIYGSGDNGGICFRYIDWRTVLRTSVRVRRDHPEVDEHGKPENKYLSSYGDRRHFFIPIGSHPLIPDKSIRRIIVEAEKSALAFEQWAKDHDQKILPIAIGGCWGWRGRIGRTENAKGHRVDVKGTLSDLRDLCAGCEVVVALDSNASFNPSVYVARRRLVSQLLAMDARVLIAEVPAQAGGLEANGPDDLRRLGGDGAITALLNDARLPADGLVSEIEQSLARINPELPDPDAVHSITALIAQVRDSIQRGIFTRRFAQATRRAGITVGAIRENINNETRALEEHTAETERQIEQAVLRSREISPGKIIADLESYLIQRMYLRQPDAGLVAAFFALNSWVYSCFDTSPYLCISSAMPGCGKNTLAMMLAEVCARPKIYVSMTEAVLFRTVDKFSPTLIVPEAATLNQRNSPTAQALLEVLKEGYKQSAIVSRVQGEDYQLVDFKVYCPKVFCAVGGLSDSQLA